MRRFDLVIFDQDGTIADSSEGILASANAAFAAVGRPQLTFEAFKPFLGPPLQQSMMERVGMTLEESERAIAVYRDAYDAGNCFRLRVFPGLEQLLQRLRAAGIQAAVASSKPNVYLEKILKGIGLRGYFSTICGVPMDRLQSGKSDLIAAAARACGVPHNRCLMVGDRRFDMEGAKALGIQSAGVLYGFGSREELTAAGADVLVEDCAALEALIFNES